ncbi:MAG: FAD-binding protein [Hyphomicrobiaceae bacterium]
MFNYDACGERATRDLVSQSMYREMLAGRTTPNGGLYISMGHLWDPTSRQDVQGHGGALRSRPRVWIWPVAWSRCCRRRTTWMGGVVVKVDTSTDVSGLFYCAGEDAGGVHGANRLGGNGVANSTVYGGISGETMAAHLKAGLGAREPDMDAAGAAMDAAQAPFRAGKGDVNAIRDQLLDLMWDDVGIIRDKAGMERALGKLDALTEALDAAGVPDGNRAFNLSWHDWLNLRSQIAMSKVVAHAAMARENSRGSHYREDFKDPGDMATSRFTVVRKADGALNVTTEPVQFTHVKPGETLIKDEPQAAE